MAKHRALEAAKDLGTNAGMLLENILRIKKNVSETLQYLRRIEGQFVQQEEQRREEAHMEARRQMLERQRTAWVMTDPDEEALITQAETEHPAPPVVEYAFAGTAPLSEAAEDVAPEAPAVKADEPTASVDTATAVSEVTPEPIKPEREDKPAITAKVEETAAAEPVVKKKAEAKPTQPASPPREQQKPRGDQRPQESRRGGRQDAHRDAKPAGQGRPQHGRGDRELPPGTPPGYPLKPGIQGRILPPEQQSRPQGPRPLQPAGQQGPRPLQPAGQQGLPRTQGTPGQGVQGQYIQRQFTPQGQPPRQQFGGQGQQAGGTRTFTPGGPRPGFQPQGGGQMGTRPFAPGAQKPGGAAVGARPGFGAPRPGGFRKPAELPPTIEKERVSNYDPNKKLYQRQHDPERVAKNRKQLARDAGTGMHDDDVVRGGRKSKKRAPSAQQMMDPIRIDRAFMTAETITVKDLSERIGKTAGEIMKKLLLLGTMATINQELDFDTASLVCAEFGVELEVKYDKTAEDILSDENFDDTEDDLIERPPVVTIMGHVDHGKTTLLDYIRKTRVAAGEAGGITQHIGAYQVSVNGRSITFLDTPGHEAFTAMRARGANATDIVILVVAADDSVMPQTIEALNHARAANVPIIVAITKIDKPGVNVDRVKQDLVGRGVVPEEWGGDAIITPVSAVTGENVPTLLEMILLVADIQQLRANPNRRARGLILEARLDKGRGPVATALVQNGTLRVGDTVVAGTSYGRIRAMLDDQGRRVDLAGPSAPVEIIGFGEVPDAGDEINAVEDDRLSRLVAEERRTKAKAALVKSGSAKVSLDDLYTQISEGQVKDLNLIVKADVQGSAEAVTQSLERLSMDEVRVRVIHGGVGAITENDVMLASTAGAIIIGFNVRPDGGAADTAKREGIDVRLYRVIYDAINDVEKAMKGLLAPQFKETVLGRAQVRQLFKVTGVGTIAGCYVTDGKIARNGMVRLTRGHVVVYEGRISSLKHLKDDAREIQQGFECGVGIERFNDVKINDEIECYIKEEIAR